MGEEAAGPAEILSDALTGTHVISVEETPRAKLFTEGREDPGMR